VVGKVELLNRVYGSDKKGRVKSEPGEDKDHKEGVAENIDYCDDFIHNSSDDDEMDMESRAALRPRGWDSLCAEKKPKAGSLAMGVVPFDDWLQPPEGEEEKLVLFQVPDVLVNRPEGKIGRLRVYKSGRIELVDTEAGITFDVLQPHVQSQAKAGVKTEGCDTKSRPQTSTEGNVSQELVHLSDNSLTSLGRLNSRDILIPVPRLPDTLDTK
jgi:hypothetical protein